MGADGEDAVLDAGGEEVGDQLLGDGEALGLDESASVLGDLVELVLKGQGAGGHSLIIGAERFRASVRPIHVAMRLRHEWGTQMVVLHRCSFGGVVAGWGGFGCGGFLCEGFVVGGGDARGLHVFEEGDQTFEALFAGCLVAGDGVAGVYAGAHEAVAGSVIGDGFESLAGRLHGCDGGGEGGSDAGVVAGVEAEDGRGDGADVSGAGAVEDEGGGEIVAVGGEGE